MENNLDFYKKSENTTYRCGVSYLKRVREVNEIYDKYIKTGLSNREIFRRYIYPKYGISEGTYYNYLKRGTF